MVSKQNAALRALHELIVAARFRAYHGDASEAATILDDIEILPKYLATHTDETLAYEEVIQSVISKLSGLSYVHEHFVQDIPDDW